jgi:Mn-dependent DtxR family transcriptional regulator
MDGHLEQEILRVLTGSTGAMRLMYIAAAVGVDQSTVRQALVRLQAVGKVENPKHGIWALVGAPDQEVMRAKETPRMNPGLAYISSEISKGQFVRPSQVSAYLGVSRERGRQLCVSAVANGIGLAGPRGVVCPPDIKEIPKHRDIFPSALVTSVHEYMESVSCARSYEVAKAIQKTGGSVSTVLKQGQESGKYDRYMSGSYSIKGRPPLMVDVIFPVTGKLNGYVRRIIEILKTGSKINQLHLSAELGIASSVIGRALSDLEAWGEVNWQGQGQWEYVGPVYAQPGEPMQVNEEVMQILADGKNWRVLDIVDQLTIGETRVGHTLSSLVRKGYVERSSEGVYRMVKPLDGGEDDGAEGIEA